ncbi:hypothetical protein BH18ACT15_BH18ACT15_10490 [soil metagenome]
MGIGVSLFFLAVGAILTWAVEASISGLDVNVVGIILMVIGALGLLLTLMFWSGISGRRRTEGTVVRERQVDRDVV